jgi:hypothetical protein
VEDSALSSSSESVTGDLRTNINGQVTEKQTVFLPQACKYSYFSLHGLPEVWCYRAWEAALSG